MSTWVSSGLRDARRGRRAANYTWRAVHGARCAGRLGRGWDRRLARPPPGACDLTSLTSRVLFSGVGSYPATCCCCRRCCCYYYEYDYYDDHDCYDDYQPPAAAAA